MVTVQGWVSFYVQEVIGNSNEKRHPPNREECESRAGKQRIASSLAKLGLEGLHRKLEGNIGGPWV